MDQDITIAGGLTDSDERKVWEASVDKQARRLRIYREHMPSKHKYAHWVVVGLLTFICADLILNPASFEVIVADGPVMIGITAIALGAAASVVVAGVSGRDLWWQTAEKRATLNAQRRAS